MFSKEELKIIKKDLKVRLKETKVYLKNIKETPYGMQGMAKKNIELYKSIIKKCEEETK